jgi:hypothetical protein
VRFTHREHPGRAVRLAYCLNLHAAETLGDLHEGLCKITLPLRDRLAQQAETFGVGMYLAGALVREHPAGSRGIEELGQFLERERLDPFTFNAFPFGGFATAGLKERVFEPTWVEPARLEYTSEVARIAAELNPGLPPESHISISTHTGGFGKSLERLHPESVLWNAYGELGLELDRLERTNGCRIALALEPEPGANVGNTSELADFFERWSAEVQHDDDTPQGGPFTRRQFERFCGICLDACHSAVEFEEACVALDHAAACGAFGKLQFTSALVLPQPARNRAGLEHLLALSEPRYLHQVAGRDGEQLLHARDLPELAQSLKDVPKSVRWMACDELRCHFHVPVDCEDLGDGLRTTRSHADALLDGLLGEPARWKAPELHVEIETYTWDVLPGAARGPGSLVEGLEREYRHVIGRLEARGWLRAG